MGDIHVILVDDHPVVRAGIRTLLDRADDICVVAETDNGDGVLSLVEKHRPDVLILDIEMPGLSGVEVAQQLQTRQLPTRVLALSAHADIRYIDHILANGAFGYLVKEEAPQMIIAAVRGVAAGEQGWMSRQASAEMNARLSRSQSISELTPREQEVLALVAAGKSNQEIALALQISESTVEKHLSSVYTKLDVGSRVEAAVLAVRNRLV